MKNSFVISTSAVSLLALMANPSKIIAQQQLNEEHAPRYTVTDLGTLGGTYSIAFTISRAGHVAGSASLAAGGPQHAFVRYGGHLKDLGTLGGLNSIAGGPNMKGQLAVYSETADPAYMGEDFCGFGNHLQCLAAIWQDGKMTPFPTLPGGDSAQALGLNDRGDLFGFAENDTLEKSGYCATPRFSILKQ